MAAGWITKVVKAVAGNFNAPFHSANTSDADALQVPGNILVDEAHASVMGDVTASPAANTVLDRLKTLATLLTSISNQLTTIDGRVDGLESLIGTTNSTLATTNSTLTTIDGRVDGLEALIGTTNTSIASTNTKLDTLHADVDGLETLVTSTNTKLDTLHADVDGLETAVASTNTKLDTVNTHLTDVETATEATASTLASVAADTSSSLVHTKLKSTHKVFGIDATAVASGDILADTETVADALMASDLTQFCYGITLYDLSDQAASALLLRIIFLKTATSLGSENSPTSIADGSAPNIISWIDVVEANWIDMGAFKIAHVVPTGGRVPVQALSGTGDIAVGVVAAAAMDFGAATDFGVTFHIG